MSNDTKESASTDEPKTKDGDYSAGAKAMIGAVMPCGACVTNVYEAYRAGERAALARAPLPAQLPQKSWLDAPHDIANEHANAWAKGWNAARLASIAASLAGKVEQQ